MFVQKIPSLFVYKSPTTHEMPEVTTYIVEDPDRNGPYGAKEVGQGPLLPIMPAVCNAVFDAVGVRVDEIPVTPHKIYQGLQLRAKGKDARVGPDKVPAADWPEPRRVKTPWQGGEGVEEPREQAARPKEVDK